MNSNSNEINAASDVLGAPIATGLWLNRIRHRWWHNFSTGSELDLLFLLFLLPLILWKWLTKTLPKHGDETGPIFCVVTENELVLFNASEGIFKRGLKEIFDRRPLNEITSCDFYANRGKQLRLAFSDSTEITLYYSGPLREVETFISHAT